MSGLTNAIGSNKTESELTNFLVHTTGGEKLIISAHHMTVSQSENRVYFYKSKTEIDERWTVFYSGIAAIHQPEPAVLGVVAL